MEEFNYHITESNAGDAIEQFNFISRSDFCNSDVERVLFEAQDSLLGSIGSGQECPDSSVYFNPINDILSDVNEFNKNFCCDQVTGTSALPLSLHTHDSGQINSSWTSQENVSIPTTNFLSDEEKVSLDVNSAIENGIFNVNAANSVLLSDSPLVEFPASDSAIFGEYSSAINQWFHGIEQQQLPFMGTSFQSTHTQVNQSQGYSDTFLNTIGALPASTTITPVVTEEYQVMPKSASLEQHEKSTEKRLLSQKISAPSCVRRLPTIGYQKNRLHWTPVFSRKNCIQPPKMVIMHPLRTRKLIAASRRSVTSSYGNYCNATINLAEYFDTSCIDIPMIKEHTYSQCRKNRRKQKLCTIPGSENFVFEVQKNYCDELSYVPSVIGYDLNNEIDPYPENELPELDEIFRRKKKITSVSAAGSKRTCSITQSIGSVAPQKKFCEVNSYQTQLPVLQESSASFEEKISVSIRKGRSNLSIDKTDLVFSSESDSAGSGDDRDDRGLQNKSLKCQKCMKLFKTTRSLAIHTKRCTSLWCDADPLLADCSYSNNNNKHDMFKLRTGLKNLIPHSENEQKRMLESNSIIVGNPETHSTMKIITSAHSPDSKARPITRSQTRRSIGRSIQLQPFNIKRFK